jgi:hypothetical protein
MYTKTRCTRRNEELTKDLPNVCGRTAGDSAVTGFSHGIVEGLRKEGVQMRRSSGIVTAGALGLAGSLLLSAWAAQAGSERQGATTDTSYEQVELTRSQIGAPATTDTSYEQVELTRSQIGR